MDIDMKYVYSLRTFYNRLIYVCGGILIGMLIQKFVADAFTNHELSNIVFVLSTAISVLMFTSAIIETLLSKGINEYEKEQEENK